MYLQQASSVPRLKGDGKCRKKEKMCFVLSDVAFPFIYFTGYHVFLCLFYVCRNNNMLHLPQYHRFVAMAMLLLPKTLEATLLHLMEASKPMIWVLRYFHMLVAFYVQIVPDTDAKSFYLTYVYLNYM
jgi:hypothetical protein